jgi:hypothetical protein
MPDRRKNSGLQALAAPVSHPFRAHRLQTEDFVPSLFYCALIQDFDQASALEAQHPEMIDPVCGRHFF